MYVVRRYSAQDIHRIGRCTLRILCTGEGLCNSRYAVSRPTIALCGHNSCTKPSIVL